MVAESIGGQASGAVARRRRATLLVQYKDMSVRERRVERVSRGKDSRTQGAR